MPKVLQQPAFRTIWIAQFVSIFGDFLAMFAVIARITFKLHGTPQDVTLVIMALMAPLALVGPFAGVMVDRWKVKRVMIASDLIRAVLALSLVWAHDVVPIALLMVGIGFFSSFFGPAQSVALRTLVPVEDLLSANAVLSQAFYAVRILSPAIAGAIVAAFGENVCFVGDGLSFAFSAAMVSRLVIERPAGHQGSVKAITHDLAEGNRFIFTHRGLTFAFLASAAAMFMMSSFSPLISIYIRDTLHAGTMLYGAISSMVGVGLIAGTVLMQRRFKDSPMVSVIVGGLAGIAAGAALLGAFRHATTTAMSTFLLGAGIAFVIVPAQTLSQRETPHAMQGRVASTFMSLFSLAQVLGLLLSGWLATRLGIRQLFLVCGAATALVAFASWLFLRPRPQPETA
ncbi:MAG: MFS transporter [Myxococcales bacterium]|nr:MFS transporter [Myxococcales bacterium]